VNSSASVTLAPHAGTPAVGGTLTQAASAGTATFSNLSITLAGTGYSLDASSAGLTGATSSTFNVTAAGATKVVFGQQPTNTNSGQTITPAVTALIEDTFGNLVNSSASVTLAPHSPTPAVSGTLTRAAVAGTATFNDLSITTAGTGYSLDASSASLTGATSGTFNIAATIPTNVAFSVQPAGATGGTAFTTQPVVHVTDASTNPVAGATVTLSKDATSTGAGSLSGCSTPTTNASGDATFSGCKINTIGTYVLRATTGSVFGLSSSLAVAAGAPATVTFSTPPSGASGGTAFTTQPVVHVVDAGANVVPGASVTLSKDATSTGAGSLSGCNTPTTNATGDATFTGCSVNTIGIYVLRATSGAAFGLSSSLTVIVGPPTTVTFTTQPAGASGGTAFTTQPVVRVVDAGGNAVTPTTVTLTKDVSSTGQGSLSGCNVPTTASGNATFTGCKLDLGGTYVLRATSGAVFGLSGSLAVSVTSSVDVFGTGGGGLSMSRLSGASFGAVGSLGAPAGVSLVSKPATVSDSGSTWAFVIGSDGAVYYRRGTGGAATWTSAWTSLGPTLVGDPTAVNDGTNIWVFARGTDNGLWYRKFTAGVPGAWTSLGTTIMSSPSAVWDGSSIWVFGRGADNGLWYRRSTGPSTFTSWTTLGPAVLNDPSAIAVGNNVWVFEAGASDNGLWYQRWNGSSWSGWLSLGPTMVGDAGIVSDGTGIWAFIRGTDNGLWYRRWNGTSWSAWATLGTTITSDPAALWDGTNLWVFARGSDNALWYRRYNGAWGGWTSIGGSVSTGPAIGTGP
jgi:hypothetical protein